MKPDFKIKLISSLSQLCQSGFQNQANQPWFLAFPCPAFGFNLNYPQDRYHVQTNKPDSQADHAAIWKTELSSTS